MYERNLYISRIMPFVGKPPVKIITGMRRSGKSCLMRLVMDRLRSEGVPEKRILYIDKESYEFDAIRTYHDLAEYVEARRGVGRGVAQW